jgi:hypothetical protein
MQTCVGLQNERLLPQRRVVTQRCVAGIEQR